MGHLLKLKYTLGTLDVRNLASTSVPFRFTMAQSPNLTLIETKRITVYVKYSKGGGWTKIQKITEVVFPVVTPAEVQQSTGSTERRIRYEYHMVHIKALLCTRPRYENIM
jgi:hypothetical protein